MHERAMCGRHYENSSSFQDESKSDYRCIVLMAASQRQLGKKL